MPTPRISIAMTTYNGGKYLREQLDSILSQTVNDLELVICDDCSSDNTWPILAEYAARDARIRLVRNTCNLGFKKNFEQAIGLCTGEYIALSDQDDRWLPTHLETLLGLIGSKLMACGNVRLMDSQGIPIDLTLNDCSLLDCVPDDDLLKAYRLLYFTNGYQGASMLFRRELCRWALPMPDGVHVHDAWLSALACFCGGLNHTYDLVGLYRCHDHNAIGSSGKRGKVRRLRSIVRLLFPKTIETDRGTLAQAILDRVEGLSAEQTAFLTQAVRFNASCGRWWGRVRWVPFVLRHYKYIFSCGRGHWL